MTYPTLYILRHGETEWNAAGRFQGALNSPLTERGRRQAKRQGEILSGIDLADVDIRVSPQGRAFQTAAIALADKVAHLRTDDRLRELEVGAWSGLYSNDLVATGETGPDTPDGPLARLEFAPGGEGYTALRVRCAAFLQDLTGPTLCVTHGVTSRMLRAIALGQSSAGIGDLPGGQGVVHVVEQGAHKTLT